jgi:hypothetical protein
MEFLAPLMLVGALGAAVPIVIHLIGRRRAPVRRFAAMDFLLGTNRRVARRLRLRELLLLALRVLACVAIPLALAKPFVSCATRGVVVARGPQAAVLVLDDSFTMGYRREGETLLEAAKERASAILVELGTEADVALELASEGGEPAAELTRDHLRLRDTIDAVPVSSRPAQTTVALRRAAALLASSPHATKRVYLISALAASGFMPGEPPWPEGPGAPELVVVPVGEGELPNLAIVEASAEKDPDLGPRGVRIAVKVQSFGARASGHAVTLRIAGRALARGLITVEPGQTVEKKFAATLPPDARTAEVTVELDGDALAADDRRHLKVELRSDVRVLLVNGDPRTVRYEDELFYLETALRPGDRADSALTVSTTTVDELPRRRLEDYDAVFLCNVKPLPPAQVAALADWVERGGGLAVAMGDNVDADEYNARMAPLLAQELRTMRRLAEGPKAPDAGRAEKLGRFEGMHPVFRVFSTEAAGLRDASFWRVMLLGPVGSEGERVTLARFGSGAPALVEARRGEGRLMLFASTVDRDWNDLPIHPGYLPLVQQAARYLARSPVEDRDTEIVVGRARVLPVTAGDQRLEVVSPDGHRTVFEGARLRGRTEVTFTGVDVPGFYEVTVEREAGVAQAMGFVANLDPRGSDTRRLPPSALRAGSGPAAAAPPGEAKRRVELWHALAAALLGFLFLEAVLTRKG